MLEKFASSFKTIKLFDLLSHFLHKMTSYQKNVIKHFAQFILPPACDNSYMKNKFNSNRTNN